MHTNYRYFNEFSSYLLNPMIKFRVLFTLRHIPNLIIFCIRYIGYKNKTMYRFHLNFQRNITKFHSHKLTGKLLALFPNRDVRQDSKINRPPQIFPTVIFLPFSISFGGTNKSSIFGPCNGHICLIVSRSSWSALSISSARNEIRLSQIVALK